MRVHGHQCFDKAGWTLVGLAVCTAVVGAFVIWEGFKDWANGRLGLMLPNRSLAITELYTRQVYIGKMQMVIGATVPVALAILGACSLGAAHGIRPAQVSPGQADLAV
jgi:hypothetical protein